MRKRWITINTLIFFLLIEIFFPGCQQQKKPDHFTLDGKLSNLKDSIIYLQYSYGDSVRLDSAVVKDRSFSFKGKVTEPVLAFLFSQNYVGGAQIFIENAEMNLQGNSDSMNDVVLRGSASQNENMVLNESTRSLDKEIGQAYEDYQKAKTNNDQNTEAASEKKMNDLDEQRWSIVKKFIETNPKSYVSLSELSRSIYSKDYDVLFPLYSALDTSVQHSHAGMRAFKNISKLKNVSNGSMAMDFTKNDVDGKPVKLSDFRGKWVLLDFWASWCGPCREENPNVLKYYNSFKDKGFTVLGVSLDDNAANWKKAIAEDKMPWTQVSSLQGWKDPVSQEYAVEGIPSNLLIDPKGIIHARNLRGDDLGKKLKELIAE